jgi:hypothetical protein
MFTPALAPAIPTARRPSVVGRMFVSVPVDYLFVGGAITLPIFAALFLWPSVNPMASDTVRLSVFFGVNATHFAASTVRLYTKPGARQELPFLSWGFPLLCFAAIGLGLYWPRLGHQIEALYFTWSPYHYAAQTYGIALMYAFRSGARLEARDKSQIWWSCMLPFAYAFVVANTGGLFWFVPRDLVMNTPVLAATYTTVVWLLRVLVLLLPLSLFWQLYRTGSRQVPLISLLLQVTNGIWWIATDYVNAWLYTSMLHSVQYLIVIIARHADEQARDRQPQERFRSVLLNGTAFYGFSLAVALLLFIVAPALYGLAGFSPVESYAMTVFVINIHHFVVDGFIWKSPPKRTPAPALATASA